MRAIKGMLSPKIFKSIIMKVGYSLHSTKLVSLERASANARVKVIFTACLHAYNSDQKCSIFFSGRQWYGNFPYGEKKFSVKNKWMLWHSARIPVSTEHDIQN